MRAILINAKDRVVSEVELEKPTLQGMYKFIGCQMVELAGEIEEGADLFVDEEGLMNGAEYFFYYEGAHQPFAGNGLIVGCDGSGETVGTTIPFKKVVESVVFMTPQDALLKAHEIEQKGHF